MHEYMMEEYLQMMMMMKVDYQQVRCKTLKTYGKSIFVKNQHHIALYDQWYTFLEKLSHLMRDFIKSRL